MKQKTRIGSLLLAIGLLFSLLSGTVLAGEQPTKQLPFTDVKPGAWYYDAVAACYEQELFSGTSADRFSPDMAMSRAMLVTLLWRNSGSVRGEGYQYEEPFTDVNKGAWYYDAVCWARNRTLVFGVDGNHFAPERTVTREEAVTIIWRYTRFQMGELEAQGDLATFTDAAQVGGFAKAAMGWATAEELISGMKDHLLCPKQVMTRAQAAVLLQRCIPYWDVVFLSVPVGGVMVTNAEGQTFKWNPGLTYSGTMPVRSVRWMVEGVIYSVTIVVPASETFRFDAPNKDGTQMQCSLITGKACADVTVNGCDSVTLTKDGNVALQGEQITCSVTGKLDINEAYWVKWEGSCTGQAQFAFSGDTVELNSDCSQWKVSVMPDYLSNWVSAPATVPTPAATVQFFADDSAQGSYFVVK